MKHVDIRVYGRVQGVFFRHTALEQARQLGITGFARNEPDSSVYIEAEGEDATLDQFLEWCQHGPSSAHVTSVEHTEGSLRYFEDFTIVA